jgi:hypothetical protein
MSPINDEAAKRYDDERRRTDLSPAQPLGESRIDPEDVTSEPGDPHAHVKDDDDHRMEN